jgi:hypothetical protein
MKPKSKDWTEKEKRQLAQLVRKGAGVQEMRTQLGRYARSIRTMARAMKLVLRK